MYYGLGWFVELKILYKAGHIQIFQYTTIFFFSWLVRPQVTHKLVRAVGAQEHNSIKQKKR